MNSESMLQVRALNFSLPGRVAPPIILPQGGAPAVISLGIDGSLRGNIITRLQACVHDARYSRIKTLLLKVF